MADTETRAALQGEGGLHLDGDKPAMAKYLFWPLLLESGEVWAQNNKGTEDYPSGKYPDLEDGTPNYMAGIAWTKLIDSMLRHLFAFMEGQDDDLEGSSHLSRLNCCLHMLAYNVANHPELDDRPLAKWIEGEP
jgi:hypothetical protein